MNLIRTSVIVGPYIIIRLGVYFVPTCVRMYVLWMQSIYYVRKPADLERTRYLCGHYNDWGPEVSVVSCARRSEQSRYGQFYMRFALKAVATTTTAAPTNYSVSLKIFSNRFLFAFLVARCWTPRKHIECWTYWILLDGKTNDKCRFYY